jgi:hypothetical protein
VGGKFAKTGRREVEARSREMGTDSWSSAGWSRLAGLGGEAGRSRSRLIQVAGLEVGEEGWCRRNRLAERAGLEEGSLEGDALAGYYSIVMGDASLLESGH